MAFRIELPAYRGPLDLLLYLVRRQELDVTALSLTRVVDQFFEYLDVLQELDLGGVGEFIDLASTLVELKSLAVLPTPVSEEEEVVEDPQEELVQRLLEYKQVRDAASVLDEMGDRWQQHFPRLTDSLPPRQLDPGDQPIADLELWDLVSAFGRIMREAKGPPVAEVVYDDTPIHIYMQRIHRRLCDTDRVALADLLDGGMHKSSLIGWFLAMLELTRHHGCAAEEEAGTGDIVLVRGTNFSSNLNVNEVDNYDASAIKDSNMPVAGR
ncbi:Segregation and condensation protein A [Roseimaritima multifibrata]|uniref:Segregation and condensation protein A n=1 Tax=Roseimaritima multifibrata TaxID=1930274 RepID=A0A517MCU7_9BACT|nr:ScpA family protein [Roseimaritima multifibrata]QDS92709.1 Segregation and condensation protein A [Roseimaritima multifibrata]